MTVTNSLLAKLISRQASCRMVFGSVVFALSFGLMGAAKLQAAEVNIYSHRQQFLCNPSSMRSPVKPVSRQMLSMPRKGWRNGFRQKARQAPPM